MIKSANQLVVSLNKKGSTVLINYQIDEEFNGTIKVLFPFKLIKTNNSTLSFLGIGATFLLAQYCLAKNITINFPHSPKMVESIFPLIKILYDVRIYSEGMRKYYYPKIFSANQFYFTRNKLGVIRKNKKACLMWSGGLDSTYSLHLLKNNGYSVIPVHTNINLNLSNSESKAVQRLSKLLHINPIYVKTSFPQQRVIGRYYSEKFDKSPNFNAIPFGRDFFQTGVALIVAVEQGASNICFGHEYELWKNEIPLNKKQTIYRNDTQSEYANVVINNTIQKNISPDLRIFSPISSLRKFFIYQEMVTKYQSEMKYLISCYFGKNCGDCQNCLLYQALYECFYEKDFKESDLIKLLQKKTIIQKETFGLLLYYYYQETIHSLLKKRRYLKELKEKFGPYLDLSKEEIESELLKVHQTKLVPRDFKFKL